MELKILIMSKYNGLILIADNISFNDNTISNIKNKNKKIDLEKIPKCSYNKITEKSEIIILDDTDL